MLALSSLLHNNVRNTMATSETWSGVTLWDVFWHWICFVYSIFNQNIYIQYVLVIMCMYVYECVAMYLYTNMGTWEYSFCISDYIRMCTLSHFCQSLSRSLSPPSHFLVLFPSFTILQSLRHKAFWYKTCLTVEIILTICTYNTFVVTFSTSLLWYQ